MTAAITGYVAGGETVGPAMARCPTGVFARVCLGRDRLLHLLCDAEDHDNRRKRRNALASNHESVACRCERLDGGGLMTCCVSLSGYPQIDFA